MGEASVKGITCDDVATTWRVLEPDRSTGSPVTQSTMTVRRAGLEPQSPQEEISFGFIAVCTTVYAVYIGTNVRRQQFH